MAVRNGGIGAGCCSAWPNLSSLLLVLRLASWVFSTGLPGPDQIALWLGHPAAFLDAQFLAVGVLLILAWGLAIGITADFMELAIQPDEFAAYETHSWDESRSHQRAARAKSRVETVAQFAWRWGWGGVLLVACAAMSRTAFDLERAERAEIHHHRRKPSARHRRRRCSAISFAA